MTPPFDHAPAPGASALAEPKALAVAKSGPGRRAGRRRHHPVRFPRPRGLPRALRH